MKVVSKSNRNIFPVTNSNNELQGIVLLDDIRQIMFEPKQYDKVLVSELMSSFPLVFLQMILWIW